MGKKKRGKKIYTFLKAGINVTNNRKSRGARKNTFSQAGLNITNRKSRERNNTCFHAGCQFYH